MDALYLYCIREKTEDTSEFGTRGIDGKNDVFTIIYRELEAVVSRVFFPEFASEEIQKKALEDLNWIKGKAVIHEDVIEEAMRGPDGFVNVIPMRFGIIFKSKAGLKEVIHGDYEKMRGLLNKVRGRQEWGVKIYLADGGRFELTVKETNDEIRSKEKELASMPEGMAYFMEEELQEALRSEVNKALDTLLENAFGKLGEEAAESVKTNIIDREITGKAERMVLNTAFLVDADRVYSFKNTLEGINKDMKPKGLRLEYSGPWPPFNFACVGEKA